MAPGDMLLHIGDSITGYDNKVIIAGVEEKIGLNKELNVPKDIPVFYPDLSKVSTSQTDTQADTNKHETNKILMLAEAVRIFVVLDFLI